MAMTPNLRRTLLIYSAPAVAVCVLTIAKVLSAFVAASVASSAYQHGDRATLSTAVSWLKVLDVIEPARTHFAAGNLAVLDDRLEDADRQFSASLSLADARDTCAARVNLEFVRETQGDRAGLMSDVHNALTYYRSAVTVVEQSERGCFAGNNDADPRRQTLRNDALTRLDLKIKSLQAPSASLPPPVASAPPEAPLGTTTDDDVHQLDPTVGPPLDRLAQILRDASTNP